MNGNSDPVTVGRFSKIHSLQTGLEGTKRGASMLGDVHQLIVQVVEGNDWYAFALPSGEVVEHTTFSSFVESPLPEGLGMTLADLKDLAGDDMRVLDAIAGAEMARNPRGGARNSYVKGAERPLDVIRPGKNSTEGILRRLRRMQADADATQDERDRARALREQVLAGALAPTTAMTLLGKARRKIAVKFDDMPSAAKSLNARLTPDQRAKLARLLLEAETPEG